MWGWVCWWIRWTLSCTGLVHRDKSFIVEGRKDYLIHMPTFILDVTVSANSNARDQYTVQEDGTIKESEIHWPNTNGNVIVNVYVNSMRAAPVNGDGLRKAGSGVQDVSLTGLTVEEGDIITLEVRNTDSSEHTIRLNGSVERDDTFDVMEGYVEEGDLRQQGG